MAEFSPDFDVDDAINMPQNRPKPADAALSLTQTGHFYFNGRQRRSAGEGPQENFRQEGNLETPMIRNKRTTFRRHGDRLISHQIFT
jgi:hypothetical protein